MPGGLLISLWQPPAGASSFSPVTVPVSHSSLAEVIDVPESQLGRVGLDFDRDSRLQGPYS